MVSAPGDSGGTTFNPSGEITGITSYGITLQLVGGATSDVTPGVNDSTFGELSGDTRVSFYADWIDLNTGLVTNGAPVAVDATATVNKKNGTASGNVLSNDSDPDGAPLTASLLSNPSDGVVSLNANGTFVYTPGSSFSGIYSLTYEASDDQGASATATVFIQAKGRGGGGGGGGKPGRGGGKPRSQLVITAEHRTLLASATTSNQVSPRSGQALPTYDAIADQEDILGTTLPL